MSIEYQNPWFRVVKDGKMHFVEESSASNGAVALVKVAKHYYMVDVYRVAQGESCIEAPRGYGDPGESSKQCAIREVFEETGFDFSEDECEFLGSLMPNSALLASRVDAYLLESDAKSVSRSPDDEVSGIVRVPEDQLSSWIANGRIQDGFTLSALALLWSRQPA